jgi:TRAP transporter 4TM/12TM fusion protein
MDVHEVDELAKVDEKIKWEAGEVTRWGELSKAQKVTCFALSMIGIGLAVGYTFGFSWRGEALADFAYYWLFIAIFLPGVFLIMPARKKDKTIPWYDLVFASLSCIIAIYFYTHAWEVFEEGWKNIPVGVVLWLLILEASRRGGGPIYLVTCLLFGLYPLVAESMPGMFWGRQYSFNDTIGSLIFMREGLMGIPTKVVAETIFGFMVFAGVMVGSGAGQLFMDLAISIMGRYRGGAAKVSVLSSAFFGSLSGSAFSNVIGTGCITIPTMKRTGFHPEYAGATEAVASTGGILMPPVMGAVAFIMCQMIGVEYYVVALAAVIPSFLYYSGLLFQIDAYAAKTGLVGIPKNEIPSFWKSLLESWPILVVLAFLTWGLMYMRWERLAPWYATGLLFLLSYRSRKTMITPQKFSQIVVVTMRLLIQTAALLLPMAFVMGGLLITGVSGSFASGLVTIGKGSPFLVLLLGVIACYIMGMIGMLSAAYIFLAVTMAPAVMQLGNFNLIAVHLFILYYSMLALITPPVAGAAFLGAAIAGADPMRTALRAIRLGSVIYFVPFFFVYNPALILQGPILEGIYLFLLCLVGVALISWGLEGYMLKVGKVAMWARPLLIIGGFLIAFPEWGTTIVGGILSLIVIAVLWVEKRKKV